MAKALRAANEFDADNRFFLMAGDIVCEIGNTPDEIVNYTNIANEFNKTRPIVATQGNHDTYRFDPNIYYFGEGAAFNAFVTFPENGWDQGAHHGDDRSKSYYFYYNDVLFVVLNTMITNAATSTTNPGTNGHDPQRNWLRQIFEKDKNNNLSKYRIVVTHINIFQGRGSSGAGETWPMPAPRNAYIDLFTEFDVDIVFQGHDHVYTRSNPLKVTNRNAALSAIDFSGTPGGVIYSIVGATGPKYYGYRNPTGTTNLFIPQIYPIRFDDPTLRDPAGHGNMSDRSVAPGVFVNVKVTDVNLTVTARIVGETAVLDTYVVPAKR